MIPPHEAIERYATGDDDVHEQVRDAINDNALPRQYFEHPVVREHGSLEDPVLPFSLFVDGVPYSQLDSVVGFWLVNMITGGRTLLAALRKRRACGCGCRGWCSFYQIFSLLKWSFWLRPIRRFLTYAMI